MGVSPSSDLDQLLGGSQPTEPLAPNAEAAPTASIAAPEEARVDDLTIVEGIGPKVAEVLMAAGITTYMKLSATAPETISEILSAAGLVGVADPGTWPAQGQMAAEGRFEDLQQWQAELIGGRPVVVDDLTKVEGIGPKVAEVLVAAGITSYTRLSATDPMRIMELLAAEGGALAAMDPSTWPAQGQMAAEGRWEDLQQWQDQLVGGRAAPTVESEDLTKIEGIGPKVQELLNAAGIQTYGQLAATTLDQLREILAAAGGIMATMAPDTWPAQSQMASEGSWEALKQWQDELNGGV